MGTLAHPYPGDARPGPQGLVQRLAEAQADVFNGVMGIHFEIAPAAQGEIPPGPEGDQVDHVVGKAVPGLDGNFTFPVDRKDCADGCFFRGPFDRRRAFFHGAPSL
jgi:hypothetical protein